mmetsp:Transcript_68730/g.179031  ORF Transcript_68730/g.179031 Transcript_68730/m.179031 type:complete len:311 (+) Transcript_68730:544-1476(+)
MPYVQVVGQPVLGCLRTPLAHVAAAARWLPREPLPEKLQQPRPPALEVLCGKFLQGSQRGHGRLKRRVAQPALPDHHLGEPEVLLPAQQHALARQPVAAGAAHLLVVCLHALGGAVMYHPPDVRLIDAHPESHGGDDHRGRARVEGMVSRIARLAGHARVVEDHGVGLFDSSEAALQQFGDPLREHSGGAVDDGGLDAFGGAGLIANVAQQEVEVLAHVPGASSLGHDLHEQVGSIERALVHVRVPEAQAPDDILADSGCRGCSQGHQWYAWQFIADETENRVLPTKGVAPLGHAVGLVHGHQLQDASRG